MPTTIQLMSSDTEIAATFAVMHQLRPHLRPESYPAQVQRQRATQAYHLAAVIEDGQVRAVAGFRYAESLSWGRFVYVDDLISDGDARSKGFGHQLLDWVAQRGREAGCVQLHLDSGVQRHGAHRFYLRERMDITCYHFSRAL